jgi:hypothetical protein
MNYMCGCLCHNVQTHPLALLLLSLTAIGLSPGDNSPTLVQTQIKIHKTTLTTKKKVQNIKNKTTK